MWVWGGGEGEGGGGSEGVAGRPATHRAQHDVARHTEEDEGQAEAEEGVESPLAARRRTEGSEGKMLGGGRRGGGTRRAFSTGRHGDHDGPRREHSQGDTLEKHGVQRMERCARARCGGDKKIFRPRTRSKTLSRSLSAQAARVSRARAAPRMDTPASTVQAGVPPLVAQLVHLVAR
jgi:hypothetical protein